MKIPAKFKEYIWLVNTIRKARRITFAEINEKWLLTDMSEGIELARSTFARHKDAIEDIFGGHRLHRHTEKAVLLTNRITCVASILHRKMTWMTTA